MKWKRPGRPAVKRGKAVYVHHLKGGPFDGEKVLVHCGGRTLSFTVGGVTGCYIESHWSESNV